MRLKARSPCLIGHSLLGSCVHLPRPLCSTLDAVDLGGRSSGPNIHGHFAQDKQGGKKAQIPRCSADEQEKEIQKDQGV